MASTFSPNLRLELIGTGDQQGTWGITTNTNLGTLLEQAIGGYETITVSNVADTTLTTSDGAADQARNMVLNLTGTITAARNVICPAIEKLYVVKNATTGGFSVTFKVTGQTGVSIPNGQTALIYVDGVDARAVTGTLGFLGGASTGSTNTFTSNQVISVNTAGDALRITQAGAGNALVIEDSTNPDATPFVVDQNGDVFVSGFVSAFSGLTVGDATSNNATYISPNGTVELINSGGAPFIDFRSLTSEDYDTRIMSRSNGLAFATGGATEKLFINSSGAFGVGGDNFGTSGQVLMSGGSAASPAWTSLGISNVTGLQTALDGKGNLNSSNNWMQPQSFNGGIYPNFKILLAGGSEGGQFSLEKPSTLTSLAGDVTVDVALSIFRVFEDGGTYRGAYLDLTAQGAAVGSKIFTTADANLNSLNSLGTAAGKFAYTTGVNTWAEANITAAGRAILDDADASAQRTTLGLVIGTNVQAYDATLQSLSGLGTAADRYVYTTGVDTWAEGTITAAGRAILDDANAASQRTTLGLGTIATQNASAVTITGGSISGITDLAVADGGTGASDAATARTNLGLAIGTNVQAYDATLQSLSSLGTAANRYAYTTGVDTWAEGTITAAGRAILDDADASAQRTTLGLGTAATLNAGTAAGNVVQLDGSARLPAVDGSQLTNLSIPAVDTSGRLLRAPQILTTGTSYTTPSGCNAIYVELVGGGATGSGVQPGNGGGGGAYCAKYFAVSPSTAYSYTIGATGTTAGNTTFTVGANTVTAGGANATAGGTASLGDLNINGGLAGLGYSIGSTGAQISGDGGDSFFGFGGKSVVGTTNASGRAGTGYGAGGSGGVQGSGGGAGTSGMIRVWEYA